VRFGVFKAVSMMSMVLLVSAPCSFVRECKIFGKTCHHLQGWSDWFIAIGDYISQNCGHQLAYFSSRKWYVSVDSHNDDAGWE
jgi:hypothetical protein